VVFELNVRNFLTHSIHICDSLSQLVPIVELRDSHQRLPAVKHEITLETLRSATFRNLASRDAQIAHFPRSPDQFSFQMIADLFRTPKTTAWQIYKRFKHVDHEDSISKYGIISSRPPNSLPLREKERRVITWIGDC
jgi:hypothetical protein